MRSLPRIVATGFLATGFALTASGDEIEDIRQQELDARTDVVEVAPLLLPSNWSVEALILNPSWRPVTYQLDELDAEGSASMRDQGVIPPKSHAVVPLDPLPGEAAAVRLSYFDLPGGLSSRLVFRSSNGANVKLFAQEFKAPSESSLPSEALISWVRQSGGHAVVSVTNVGDEPATRRMRRRRSWWMERPFLGRSRLPRTFGRVSPSKESPTTSRRQ